MPHSRSLALLLVASPLVATASDQGTCMGSSLLQLHAQTEKAIGEQTSIRVRNSCPFAIKAIDGTEDTWRIVEVQPGSEGVIDTDQCDSACRAYFAPATWSGQPGKYSMADVEVMGFFEYTKVGNSISPDISYIGGIGFPMTLQCAGDPLYGCTDGGYGGWESFQSRLKDFCPGEVKQFEQSDISYCSPGQYGEVESLPFGRKWDIPRTFEKAGVSMSQPNPQSLATCQPWSENVQCAQVARGSSECTKENVCSGEDLFYQGYDMRDVSVDDKWSFNGYAAFVHTICGVYSGFAFAADDQGVGIRNGTQMKYASNKGFGCTSPVIELCPAASTSFTESGGFTYPPAALGVLRPSTTAATPRPTMEPSPSPAQAKPLSPPAPTPSPTPAHSPATKVDSCGAYGSWPLVDNGVTCSDTCTALVKVDHSNGGRCDQYCESFGHVCVAAAEEVNEDCAVKYTASCSEPILGTSDILCSCHLPSSLSPSPAPATPLPTPAPTPSLTPAPSPATKVDSCAAYISWPLVDNGVTCSDTCTALVKVDHSNGGRCDQYCESFGHVCVAAAEEVNEDCAVKYIGSCSEPIEGTSDMLCTCHH